MKLDRWQEECAFIDVCSGTWMPAGELGWLGLIGLQVSYHGCGGHSTVSNLTPLYTWDEGLSLSLSVYLGIRST